jgi:hypothetical protein
MRPSILLLITFLAFHSLAAQNQLYIFAGPQATTARYKVRGIEQETGFKYGFQAGINMKTLFEGPLYFSPAVFYSLKGYQVDFTDYANPPSLFAVNNETTIHTLELAPLLQIDLSKNQSHPYIKFGPSMDFQLFGNEKFDTVINGNRGTVDRKMKFSFADYGHYSINLFLQFGFESANGFQVFAQYTHGMGNINNADLGPMIKHRIYGISFGWRIRNKENLDIDTRNRQ